jgi:hypothetical protein
MERESFESEELAGILNRWFVPVKVDREERPDVDRIYMTFVQAFTGSGDWPMSVFLTPQLKPFFGGKGHAPELALKAELMRSSYVRMYGSWAKVTVRGATCERAASLDGEDCGESFPWRECGLGLKPGYKLFQESAGSGGHCR